MDETRHAEGGMWLAQYDFRTKQRYIFRTSRIKEIVGASALITCMYDLFLDGLMEKGISVRKNYKFPTRITGKDGWQYSVDRFIDLKYDNEADALFDTDLGQSDGIVLYVGGGNLYILWKDYETAIRANHFLCALLREETYSLFPACGMTPYTGKYHDDIERLTENFNQSKEELTPFMPMAVLPFTRVDRRTSYPVAKVIQTTEGNQEYLPQECWLKRNVNDRRIKVSQPEEDPLGVSELDEMTQKGTDSLLAVLHIDGNNMGSRVSREMSEDNEKPLQNYSEAVTKIRGFSNEIQMNFVTRPLEEIGKWLTEHKQRARIIVAGGDDVTLVCGAKNAFELAKVYFQTLIDRNNAKQDKSKIDTACAGMCIFHSHSPFATAYQIAEECCDNAKKVNRQHGSGNMLLDFQYCFSGITGDLETMREADAALMGRPYCFWSDKENGLKTAMKLEKYGVLCNDIGRSNVKQLASLLLMNRKQEFLLEIQRLMTIVLAPAAKEFLEELADDKAQQYLFDIAQVFDLWFREERRL